MIEDGVRRLEERPYGKEMAHTCHYIMDLLFELSNRKRIENGE